MVRYHVVLVSPSWVVVGGGEKHEDTLGVFIPTPAPVPINIPKQRVRVHMLNNSCFLISITASLSI